MLDGLIQSSTFVAGFVLGMVLGVISATISVIALVHESAQRKQGL